ALQPVAALPQERRHLLTYEATSDIVVLFIYSGQFDRETLDALYNLIVDGDDGRDVPRHYWTLVEIGRAPATPPEIIRRMVLETPPKFRTEALTAAAYNPHA